VVSSFKPEVLTALHGLDPAIPLGFICDRRDELDRWRNLPIAWLIPHFEVADQALIAQVQASGKKVMVWTVNRENHMRRFAELGVDAVISDKTELAPRVLTVQ
jgi:glycerophosphoryl diester phosphodiesterase